jgi:hypothetical protein
MNEEPRTYVNAQWLGKEVVVYPLNGRGDTVGEHRGWLREITEDGIEYRLRYYSDFHERGMPGTLVKLAWDRVGYVDLVQEGNF